MSPILFTSYGEYLTKEAVEGFGDFKIQQVIRTMNYADNLVLSEEEGVLQGMTERLVDAGICYGMEMDLEKKNEGNENLKATIPITECDK